MPLLRLIAVTLLVLGSATPLGWRAVAKPLYEDQCASLVIEQKELLTREVKEALTRGPDWVKDHLDPAKIEQVRRYLSVEEKLTFRCQGGGMKRVAVPLPDRKPPPPVASATTTENAADTTTETADAKPDTGMPLPDRKPLVAATVEVKPSQTVADSDKTAPPVPKATP